MKSTHDKPNKSKKRIDTLKNILEQQEVMNKDLTKLPSVRTDNSAKTHCDHKKPLATMTDSSPHRPIDIYQELIEKEVMRAASMLEIDSSELKAWIALQVGVPPKTILTMLRTMQNLLLDPLKEELALAEYSDGIWQVHVTIEGCSKLLNEHPQFNGLAFAQSDSTIDGIPEWMECSIYRRDRLLPITVREYLVEVRGDSEVWQKMPRRMLRHRALQQCVRLAIV